jgi:hypothetical protein
MDMDEEIRDLSGTHKYRMYYQEAMSAQRVLGWLMGSSMYWYSDSTNIMSM